MHNIDRKWVCAGDSLKIRVNGDAIGWDFEVAVEDYGYDVSYDKKSRCIALPSAALKEYEGNSVTVYIIATPKMGYGGVSKVSEETEIQCISTRGNVLRIPPKTKTIESQAFVHCGAETVIIPESCISVGSEAFADCKNLKYVCILSTDTSVAEDTFRGSDQAVLLR